MNANERVTVLSGGGTVYLYAPGDPNIQAMSDVLDVAYPGSDVERVTVPVGTWEAMRPRLREEGIEVVDVRNAGEATP
jgi:hypothetical protein